MKEKRELKEEKRRKRKGEHEKYNPKTWSDLLGVSGGAGSNGPVPLLVSVPFSHLFSHWHRQPGWFF